jgi:hypothetical protein
MIPSDVNRVLKTIHRFHIESSLRFVALTSRQFKRVTLMNNRTQCVSALNKICSQTAFIILHVTLSLWANDDTDVHNRAAQKIRVKLEAIFTVPTIILKLTMDPS